MKKAKTIIILSILLFLSISSLVVISKRNKKKINQLNNIPSEEKTKIIIEKQDNNNKLRKIVKEGNKIIEYLSFRLKKTTDELASITKKKNEIILFVMGGFSYIENDNKFIPDVYIGIEYNRVLFYGKRFNIFIGIGAAIKPYENIGLAIKLNLIGTEW